MLFVSTIFLTVLILVGLLVQCLPVVRMIQLVKKSPSDLLPEQSYPPTAVVLSLRGGDPFLSECLKRLLCQDYPDYQLIVALDHPGDPAAAIVDKMVEEIRPTNLLKKVITDRPSRCTLVNHNYATIVEELDSRFEFVVFVDADAVTWPTWLKRLVRPLIDDPNCGGTSGNRWYAPDRCNAGTLTRAIWNMGSLVQMGTFHYPWGGSFAVRATVAKSDSMLRAWRSTMTGDTPVFGVIKELGLTYHFNPSVILLNRENTTLKSFMQWMPRQLLNGRLYHSHWTPVLVQAILSSVVLLVALYTNTINLVQGNWYEFSALGGSLILFWITFYALFLKLNSTICERFLVEQNSPDWLSAKASLQTLFLVPFVQFAYFYGVIRALFISKVNWRGIEYEIDAPHEIRLVEYKPFIPPASDPSESL